MQNLPTSNELSELLTYLSKPEADELQAIIQGTPDPIKFLIVLVNPDRSVKAYATPTPDGLRFLEPDDPLLAG